MITLTTTQDLTQSQKDLLNAIQDVTVTGSRTVECADDTAEEKADKTLEKLGLEILD